MKGNVMKKLVIVLGIAVISLVSACVSANAEIITFSDTNKYWSGWGNGSSDDSQDVIGIPNFTGGQAAVTNGVLNNLTINRAAGAPSYWRILTPGDLFIDVDADKGWDYVVDLSAWGSSGVNVNGPLAAGNYNIYSISLDLNSQGNGYIRSGADGVGGWAGYGIRGNHPVAANIDFLQGQNIGSAAFSGWGNGATTQYSFDFNGLNLGNSGQFAFSWQPNCANDVLYETLRYTATPEPATMALMGMGLAGLLGLRKKRA